MKKLYFLLVIICISHPIYAQLYINEFMAENNQTIRDNAHQYEDWIEIYNGYDYSINVSSMYLTDDFNKPKKWAFPDVSIPAKGFLLIWADDDTKQGSLHANFKLGASGEQIGLYDGANFLDSLAFGWQIADFSYGRYPDGASEWFSYYEPTPNAPNNIPITEFAEAPSFSLPGGFYIGTVTVELSVLSTDAKIFYTLDCSDPTKQGTPYTEPIVINSMTVIRARAFEDGYIPGEIISNSYLIDKDHDIATFSLVTDPGNLWDPEIGICQNPYETGSKWERPAVMEFFEADGTPVFSLPVGIRINTEISRALEKLSFQIYLRSEYGHSWLDSQLFQSKDIDEFKRFILNATFQDSPANTLDDSGTLLRDAVGYELGRQIEKNISLANRPVVAYLNNEPWGIYYILEKIDEYFLETNFGIEDGDIIENYSDVIEGSMDRWNEMIEFFETSDLRRSENYEKAKAYIDIQNFTRYNVVEIYAGNMIWPGNNNIAYSSKSGTDGWKWLLWDLDHAFVYTSVNTFEHATAKDSPGTIILRKLLENKEYKHYFINSFADYFNTILLPDHVKATIDSLAAVIRNDIYFEIDQWGGTLSEWEENVNFIKKFADHRLNVLYDYLMGDFNIKSKQLVTLKTPQGGQGKMRINNIYIDHFPWSGIYFKEVPIELEAIANPGFKFNKWSDPSLPDTPIVSVTLSSDYDVFPVFEQDIISYNIVINEINYNSTPDFDPADWVELHNFSDRIIEVSGWHFKDSDELHDFVFPSNITIEANGFLVLCRDTSAFHRSFPAVTDYTGDINFGFSGGGELLRLYDERGNLVDSLTYANEPPWPIEPDGQGATLELVDPSLDNALPESWQASDGHGTPGKPNSKPISSIHDKIAIAEIPARCTLYQNYPNPFNSDTQIEFQIPQFGQVSIKIYNLKGSEIRTILNENKPAGSYRVAWDGKDNHGSAMPSGIYMLQLKSNGFVQGKKMILMK